MRRLFLAGLVLALAASAHAQAPGSCQLGTAQADLATPDLFARLFNTGALFFGNDTDGSFGHRGYLVPRASGNSSIFAAALWFGGRVGGEVRTSAALYEEYQMWPGPLGDNGRPVNPADCSAYDRIYVVSPEDVTEYEKSGTASADLAAWPVGLGAPSVNASGQPVVVTSREQVLDLAAGERPVVRGGPTAFWVMNDVGNVHSNWNGDPPGAPLGIEVQATAFLPASGAAVFRQATAYRFTVVNRSAAAIEGFHAGLFADTDLGDYLDDYIGSDSTRGMGYTYNADAVDDEYGVPPALGIDVLSGAWSSVYFLSQPGPFGSPTRAADYYNALRGLWIDGTPVRAFADGYAETQGDVTRYMFNGDPVTGQPWNEINTGTGEPNTPGDRRFAVSAAPVTLAPGAAHSVDLAIVYAQGDSNLGSVTALRTASDVVQAAYDSGALFAGQFPSGSLAAPALLAPDEGAAFYESDVPLAWTPVGGADSYLVEISTTPGFSNPQTFASNEAQAVLPLAQIPVNRTAPFYWRVRSVAGGLDGPPSAGRSFTAYRYEAGPLTLDSGALAFVETTAPGGAPACTAGSTDEGCVEVGGDLVYEQPNSTGDYAVGFGNGAATLAAISPNDIEIRFTDAGSIGYVGDRLFRVPFEAWDVGPTTPGQPNDPSDDRQLVAELRGVAPETCAFGYDSLSRLGFGMASPYIYGYLPTSGRTYADFAAVAEPLVAADPAGCPRGAATAPALTLVDRSPASLRIRSVYFEQVGARTPPELAGSTVRFYTADRVVSSEGGTVAPRVSQLGAAFPNPARASLTVPYTLAVAGVVRLRLVDVLGRTVAVLADGPQAAGDHEAWLDARSLAAGVYAVVLEAGDARSTRTVTVVR